MHFNHILVTTDFSTNAGAAYEIAAHQAKFEGSKVTLLHVVADWVVPATMFEYFPNPERIEEYRNAIKRDALEKLEHVAKESFHSQRVEVAAFATMEATYKAICEFARAQECDLIIMASRGHGALATFVLGSTAQRVCQSAPCAVMIVPPRHAGGRENH